MEPDRNPLSDGVGVHSRKSRKDSSKRPHNKAPAKDGKSQSLLDDLLRAPRSKQTINVTSSNPSVAASNSKPVSGSASQSTLADFTQTAATVSMLSDLGKQRNNEKTSDTGPTDSVENPKRKKLDLNSFKFGRKAPFSASGSPSPPSVRRGDTPLRDEHHEDEILASHRDHLLRQEAQERLRQHGSHENQLRYGVPDGGANLGQNQFFEGRLI